MAGRRGRGEPVTEEDRKKITREGLRESMDIFRFVLPYKWKFILGLVFLSLSTGATFFFITFLKDLIDPAVQQVDGWESRLQDIALYLGLILVGQAVFSFLRIYLFARVSENTLADIRLELYRKLVSLGIPFFEQRRVGELTSRITSDVGQLQSALSVTLAEFLRQILTFIIGLGLLFNVSFQLTLVMMASFPVAIILAMVIGRYIRKVSKQSQDELAEANVVVEETLQSIHTVKAFTNEWFEIKRYADAMKRVVRFALKAADARGLFVVFLITAVFGGITLVIWYGARLIGLDEISIGDLVYFIMITLFIGGSIAGLGDMYGQLQKTLGASERLRDILREGGEQVRMEQPGEADQTPKLKGDIQFKGVQFAYPTRPETEVLKGISLSIQSGEKVALVGHSGAGKSTIAQLILNYYPIQGGTVEIDGLPINEYDLPALRDHIAVVPQEVMLFGGTIRENIAYGRPEALEGNIISAAKQAYAWEFIREFPEGLDTVVGERGIKLSGGQRQRIAIARAILRDPAILILDEATSSLDASSEHLVQQALNALMTGRTTLIIAHRLSTIRQVDRIYVLDGGQIIETGTHTELSIRENGTYAALLRLQMETGLAE